MIRTTFFALVVCSLAIATGCGAPTRDASDEPQLTRTIVTLAADGREHVEVQPLTRREQLAEIAAREASEARRAAARAQGLGVAEEPIQYDGSCLGSSLWVYDNADRSGNEICFFGQGIASLGSYSRWVCTPAWTCYQSTWSAAVRSYWPGNEDGYFEYFLGDLGLTESFNAFGPATNAGNLAQQATLLVLTN